MQSKPRPHMKQTTSISNRPKQVETNDITSCAEYTFNNKKKVIKKCLKDANTQLRPRQT